MRTHSASALLSAVLVLFVVLSPPARAGYPSGGSGGPPEKPASSPAAGHGAPGRPWESAQSAALSADGRWFVCTVNAGSDWSRMLIRDVDGRHRREVADAREPAFSADSKSLIYSIASAEGFEYVVRDLKTWTTKRSFRGPSRVIATPDARHLVIKGSPRMTDPNGAGRPSGADEVYIYSLIEDRITTVGPASFHELSGDGQFVALVKAGPDGRTALDVLRLGEIEARRVLEMRGEVSALAWGDDHRSLALVIAQDKPDGKTVDLLVAVDDVTAKTPRVRSVLPEEHAAWPKDAYLDPTAPQIGTAGVVVYFRVRDGAVAVPRQPRDGDVEIHRSADEVLYDSVTDSLKEGAPGAGGGTFAWIPEDGRMIKVADEGQTSVIPLRGGRTVLMPRGGAGPRSFDFPPVEWDVVDTMAGSRTSLGMRPVTGVSPSLTGRYVAYFDQGHWWAYDTTDGSRRALTAAPGPSFEADLAMGRGAGGLITGVEWLEDDRGMVAHDKHDAWLLRLDGTAPRRLTRGRERGRVYRLAATGGRRYASGGPYDFHVVETRSKHAGYVRVGADGTEVIIAFGPWAFDKFAKARDAERFVFQRESYDTPPNFFTATARGGGPCPMTDMNVRDDTVPRPRRELIQYRDRREAELQGTLVYPVDYDLSKKYPMVVAIYSIRSDEHFRFRPAPGLFDDPPGKPHLISSIEQCFLSVLITRGALQPLGLDPASATRLVLQ